MIKNRDGERTTPKLLASEIILQELEGAYYWTERLYPDQIESLTEREKLLINAQIEKIVDRIRRKLSQGG